MLNGHTYTNLVKYFWVMIEVIDQYEAHREIRFKHKESEANKGKSRQDWV